MKRLIKTLHGEQGELFCICEGRRILLSRCRPVVEILEEIQYISAIGNCGRVKSSRITVVLCREQDFTRAVDAAFLGTVTRFELRADIQRQDGIFEQIILDNLLPVEIDLSGDWKFELVGQDQLAKRLLTI